MVSLGVPLWSSCVPPLPRCKLRARVGPASCPEQGDPRAPALQASCRWTRAPAALQVDLVGSGRRSAQLGQLLGSALGSSARSWEPDLGCAACMLPAGSRVPGMQPDSSRRQQPHGAQRAGLEVRLQPLSPSRGGLDASASPTAYPNKKLDTLCRSSAPRAACNTANTALHSSWGTHAAMTHGTATSELVVVATSRQTRPSNRPGIHIICRWRWERGSRSLTASKACALFNHSAGRDPNTTELSAIPITRLSLQQAAAAIQAAEVKGCTIS
jgi:hypothetical protein